MDLVSRQKHEIKVRNGPLDGQTYECLLLARLKAKKHDHDNCWFMPGITDIIPEKVTKLVTKAFIAAWSKTRELGLCHAWPIGR